MLLISQSFRCVSSPRFLLAVLGERLPAEVDAVHRAGAMSAEAGPAEQNGAALGAWEPAPFYSLREKNINAVKTVSLHPSGHRVVTPAVCPANGALC